MELLGHQSGIMGKGINRHFSKITSLSGKRATLDAEIRCFFGIFVNMRSVLFLFTSLLLSLMACQPIRFFDETPLIEFVAVEPGQVREGLDSLVLVFSFKDGDGDLGLEAGDTTNDITVIDRRNGEPNFGEIEYPYRLPFVTPPGQSKQISGEVRLTIQNTFRRPGLVQDTAYYHIQIRDRANRFSNKIVSTPVVIIAP
jgi:hypothetical protein